jgi:adenylyl/guanylyl cyclase-like protein with sensor domain/cyclic GMP-AMP synthase DncV-like protein
MNYDLKTQFNKFLRHLAESLDISESNYKKAEERYQAVGKWFERNESLVASFKPDIYPQGSFRLGTVIKPISDAEEYDIDLVCALGLSKGQVSQKQLKEMVGFEIKGYARANNMKSGAEEGRRCWTLNYADGIQFHMDILPAVPDGNSFKLMLESRGYSNDWVDRAIAITDNTLSNYSRVDFDWPRSNPRGYAEWFKLQMIIQFENLRTAMAKSFQARIEDIPEYRVKTPLQRAVQILKRHRDIMFVRDQEHKPISIIITTLAAHAYNNEPDILEALINIVNGMPHYIKKHGVYWVANPVNPLENFADKWNEYPQKERNFKRWLQQVRNDLIAALQLKDIQAVGDTLKSGFGEKVINEAMKNFPDSGTGTTSVPVIRKSHLPSRFSVPHRQAPLWPVQRRYSVAVSGKYKNRNGWNTFRSDSRPLPKYRDLLFTAKTDVPKPFDVYWQVVNTGQEAKRVGQLRGEIFISKSAGAGGLTQRESTKYKGIHWIECFIVKNAVCLARSGEFVVNIE